MWTANSKPYLPDCIDDKVVWLAADDVAVFSLHCLEDISHLCGGGILRLLCGNGDVSMRRCCKVPAEECALKRFVERRW